MFIVEMILDELVLDVIFNVGYWLLLFGNGWVWIGVMFELGVVDFVLMVVVWVVLEKSVMCFLLGGFLVVV